MNVGRQWEDRLRIWSEQFEKHYRRKALSLELRYFTTMERIPYERAAEGPFLPAPVGTRWGKKWEYGWFRAQVRIPEALAGQRLALTLPAAPELLVWVNGREAGSLDRCHPCLTLTREARGGEVYEIVAEGYAGHGPRPEGAGLFGVDEIPVPEPPETQVTVGEAALWVWNEAVFQTAMDYLTLYSLVKKLPEKSLRAMRIVEGLKRFTYKADFELPEPALTESLLEADRELKPLLACRNGSTAPEFTVFGQSHLDLAWLWPVEETIRKTARTYSNQLALMEEYPDYHFLLCEPPILECLRAFYPDLYRRVKEKTAQGRFYPDGALWVEADMNIPSGESLIRQFVWGRRWFREQLGADSRMAWMPDTFGFPASLPQIMKKCGVSCFATQKLLRQDPEAEPFPYNVFWWEGLDGSRVLSHIFKKNNAVFRPEDLIVRWEEDRNQQEAVSGLMYPYGYGDGGGGPTREMVETAERCRDLEGAPRCRMEPPAAFFDRALEEEIPNVWRGELYLAWHRGTLTAQAETKRGIRKAEIALKRAEYAMARRMLLGEPPAPERKEELEALWKLLLFCQFHDVAAGASIARVHEDARAKLAEVVRRADDLTADLLGRPGGETAVHNPLGWPRLYRGHVIPAQGWAVVGPESRWTPEQRSAVRRLPPEEGGGYELRNQYLTCRINEAGELVSLRLAGDETEFLSGPGNRFLLYKDVNTCYDAWEIGSMYENLPVALDPAARVQPVREEDGAALLVTRTLGRSRLTQRIVLGNGARRLDFETELDWHEKHRLLKVAFPAAVDTGEAAQEIQFGYIRRPTHRSLRSDRDKYEVCNHRYTAVWDGGAGLAVLNDCKYGVSASGGEIRLTLMRAPVIPDMTADQGLHRFTYGVYPFLGPFTRGGVVRQAAELNEPLLLGGPWSRVAEQAFFLPQNENILVDTVKPADRTENAILVRVYESMGMGTRAAFTVSDRVRRVEETDMLEENGRTVGREALSALPFGAFEIKTFLLHLEPEEDL